MMMMDMLVASLEKDFMYLQYVEPEQKLKKENLSDVMTQYELHAVLK
jgi:hypothetical protein